MENPENIPRTIHYCWYGGRNFTELGERCIESWQKNMPDYTIERWDEARLDRSIPYVDMAYRARKYAFVADYVRLQLLYERGGIYFDTDVEVIRPFDELLKEQLFFGYQSPHSVAAGVIGSVKGHPLLRLVLDRLDAEARRGSPSYEPVPDLISEVVRSYRGPAPTIFPEEYFYPYNPYSPVVVRRKPLQSNLSERTFAIHHWEGAWLGEASLRMMIAIRLKAALRRANPARWRTPALHSESLSP